MPIGVAARLWMETGDLKAATQQIQALTDRLGPTIRDFKKSKLVCGVLEGVRQVLLAVVAAPDRIRSYTASRRASEAMAGTAQPEQGRPSLRPLRSHRRQHWPSRQR